MSNQDVHKEELSQDLEEVEQKDQPYKENETRTKKVSLGKIFSLLIIVFSVLAIGFLMFANTLISSSSAFGNGDSGGGLFGSFSQIGNILNPDSREPLKGEQSGRTNFLLLGRDSTGQGLTDTVMIASYFYEEQKVTTINIPRDFYIFDGFGSTKINAVYSNAEFRNPGSGEEFMASVLEEELDLPIHYWMSVSFESVEEIVDTLGGIEVDVPNGFTDYEFPTRNYSGFVYPAPTFEAGRQTMDGNTALTYARSRKGTNGEGSDFARSRRQSIVIEGIINKLRSEDIFSNATRIRSFYDIINKYVSTSMRLDEVVSFALELKDAPESNGFNRYILDTADGITCPSQSQDGAYIIIYCDGSTAGRAGVSTSRQKLQTLLENILVETENASLFEAQVAFIGNQSFDTDTIYNELLSLGFTNTLYNNNYAQEIEPATFNSIEETTIYVPDQTIRSQLKEVLQVNDLEYTIEGAIPDSRTIPDNFESADIVIWVESIGSQNSQSGQTFDSGF